MLSDDDLKMLREQLAGLDDEGLRREADARGVDIATATSREDVEALIERDAVRKAEEAAAAKPPKQPVKSGGNAKAGRRALGKELDDAQIAAVQKVWAWWSRNVPQSALSQGVWEMPKADRAEATDHGVNDGDYRVLGADWILTFRGGRFVQAAKAQPSTPADSYAHIPVADAKL